MCRKFEGHRHTATALLSAHINTAGSMERSHCTSQVCESLYPISSVGSVTWTDDGLALGGRHTLQMFEQRERERGSREGAAATGLNHGSYSNAGVHLVSIRVVVSGAMRERVVSETRESFLEFLYRLANPIFAHRVHQCYYADVLCQCYYYR